MFERFISPKKDKGLSQPRKPGLMSIYTATKLLAAKNRQEILQKIPSLLTMSAERYQKLCLKLIHNFAEFTQLLPETQNSYYSNEGGILDHGLTRACISLSLCRAYLLPKGAEDDPLTQEQALWAYTVFSAALLYNIGKVAIDLNVTLFDAYEKKICDWVPFSGSILSIPQARFYAYQHEGINRDELRRRVTRILVRQLMPDEGFLWIASNKDVLSVWLAILDDDERGGGTLGPLIPLADAQAINRYFAEIAKLSGENFELADLASIPSEFLPTDLDKTKISDAGRHFLEWLRDSINAGTITINHPDSFVHLLEGNRALMLYPEIFKQFSSRSSVYKNWQGVFREFTHLDLLHTVGSTSIQNYYKVDPEKVTKGVELNNKFHLFPNANIPTTNKPQQFIKIPYAMVGPNLTQAAEIISTGNEPGFKSGK